MLRRLAFSSSDVLAAVDVNLSAVHIGRGFGTEHINDFGDFVRRTEAVHWNLMGHDLRGPWGEDRGVDFARRDGIDADTERTEVGGHLASERGERRLRGGVGCARDRKSTRLNSSHANTSYAV